MNARRKIYGVLLMLVIIASTVDIYIILNYKIHCINNEMTELISSGELNEEAVKIKIPVKDQDNITRKGDDEIIINNKYYDIISITKCKDTIEFLCVLDKKESNLIKHFINLLHNKNNLKTKLRKITKNLIYTVSKNRLLSYDCYDVIKKNYFNFSNYKSIILDKISPPPIF